MSCNHQVMNRVLAGAAVFLASSATQADILHVPGDYRTIQEAIDAAINGDEVVVAPGTYNETINFLGKAITVRSSDGPQVTIIDASVSRCGGIGDSDCCVANGTPGCDDPECEAIVCDIYPPCCGLDWDALCAAIATKLCAVCSETQSAVLCINGERSTTILDGFTITGGTGTFDPDFSGGVGGGMYNNNTNPTVTNCTFSGNTAGGLGGGMFNSGSSPTVTNCTFSDNAADFGAGGGFGGKGGGMYNDGSSPTVTNCTFSDNTAESGGGMFNSNSSPTVIDCVFSNNGALSCGAIGCFGNGGGMENVNSSPTVTNCTFSGNTAGGRGGGMSNRKSSSPTVTNCTFSNNTASFSGGGMYNSGGSSPTVTNCTFSGNQAFAGGGMYNSSSSPTVTNCTFDGNQGAVGGGMINVNKSSPMVTNCTFSENSGGGMFNDDSSPTVTNCTFDGNQNPGGGGMANLNNSSSTVTNCTFSGNSAFTDLGGGIGAGMRNSQSSPTVTNCTFSGNFAGLAGGGMYNENSSPTVTNCTFSGNTAANGNALAFNFGPSDMTMTNCILWDGGDEIWNNDGSTITISYTDVQGSFPGTGNIDADPMFVAPGIGDYHLSTGSPCADAGNNWGVPIDTNDYDGDGNTAELFPVDLDGNPRFNADEADFDPGCGVPVVVDMGAYEYQFNPVEEVIFADLNADGAVGILDLLAVLAAWGDADNNCLADLDIDGDADIFDLLTLLAHWG